ncbi:FliH/SctL family protein [Nesterenkonia pannonica]|uniref:FliH/SctL family protein n=1 Tax=Nesterenkonia pannonica TaxID=1548602 RepID=UPI0021642E1C|nr:FliH/SctL family protein [Nesterenkonia pannonica]
MSSEQSSIVPLSFATLSAAGASAAPSVETDRAQARTQGYAAGYGAGMRAAAEQTQAQRAEHDQKLRAQREQAHAEQAEALDALARAADAFAHRALESVHTLDRSLAAAALQLAEALLGAELKDGPHSAQAALLRVLRDAEPESVRAVRMSPHAASLIADKAEQAGVRVISDASMPEGSAVADLREGFLDARLTTAVARCREAIDRAGAPSPASEAAA